MVNRLANEILLKVNQKHTLILKIADQYKIYFKRSIFKCKTAENCARVYRDYPSYCNTLMSENKNA